MSPDPTPYKAVSPKLSDHQNHQNQANASVLPQSARFRERSSHSDRNRLEASGSRPHGVMEKEEQKPGPDPLLLALRCSKASLVLSSLRQPPRSKTSRRSSSSSSVEFELRNARLLDADLAAARREATGNTRISAVELLLVVALAPLIFLFVGLLAAAAVEAAA